MYDGLAVGRGVDGIKINTVCPTKFSLERHGTTEYSKPSLDYLQKWAQQGCLLRYYKTADESVYELSPTTENALKWLEDLNKQQFVGTHSRLLQFFTLLQLSGCHTPQTGDGVLPQYKCRFIISSSRHKLFP